MLFHLKSSNIVELSQKIKYNKAMEENKKEKIELIKKSFEFKHLKKYKEAIEMLYKALEYDDIAEDNVELLSQIGDLHLLLNNYDRAYDEFQRALSINKNHAYSQKRCFDIFYETQHLNKALKLAQKMCEENKTPENYYNYLKTLVKLEKYSDAIEVFNSLDENIKLDVDILYLISTISADKKELILKKIVELDETNIKANMDLATIEFERKNYNKAVEYCLNLDEDIALAYYYIGYSEATKHNYNKALEYYSKAIQLDKDEHDFYLDLAKTYIDISWFDEALCALKKSINFSLIKNKLNNLDEKYFLSGWILIKKNEFSKALLNLNSIKENSNLYLKAQVLIQTINLKNMNLAAAKTTLEEYLNKEKENPILLDTLGAVYKELKLYKKAIEIYSKALELYPDSIYYALEIIDLLIDDENYEAALDKINDFRKKYENCANIFNSLARIYYRLKDPQKALEALNRCLELDKNTAETYYFKGLVLNDLSRFEEAKNSIYQAIKINPNIAKYYAQMARSYQGLEQYENALLYTKEAIELNQNEINFKKQAYEIALKIGNEAQIKLYQKQLKRSEEILKLKR